jgi:Flp pilus assembly protein TadD
MICVPRRIPPFLLCVAVLTIVVPAHGQDNLSISPKPAITVLDSTKEQDGLVGSVRRVKTETAKIALKDGRPIEGPPQLVEITTYGIKGNRIENTSYPIGGSIAGKEEYKYDERGNITEMTVRDDHGAILSREAYSYQFDKLGNWTKMVTSLVVFENGELKREPIEVTYRTVTYYFDDSIAKMVDAPKEPVEEPKITTAPAVPEVTNVDVRGQETLALGGQTTVQASDGTELAGTPPPLLKAPPPEGTESAFAARKENEPVESAPKTVAVAAKSVDSPAKTVEAVERPNPAPAENPSIIDHQKVAYDLYLSARNRFDSGDANGAVELYLQSIKIEPKSSEVHLNLGHAYLKLQKDREAVKAFKESIKLNPNLAEAQYGLGFVNFRLGRFRDAADAFKKATILEPRMAKAHYGLSLAYQELGMTTGLLEEYRTLERLDKSLARKLVQTFPQINFSCRLVQGCP